ncbi:MAG: hypothetical protein II861_07755 [Methanomicrobium sp.]|nr:hypothetical protein [Methanomicrobium sp.]
MNKKVNEKMSENMNEKMNGKVNENIIKDALKLAALVLYCAAVFVIADGGFGGFWVGIERISSYGLPRDPKCGICGCGEAFSEASLHSERIYC